MRKPVVGISMKTYQNNFEEALVFTENLVEYVGGETSIDLFYCPSIGILYPLAQATKQSHLKFGAQNIGALPNGPQTGEFSIEILEAIGGQYVEIGHAERKDSMNEPYELISQKVQLTLNQGLTPILCIGELTKMNDEMLKTSLREELLKSLQNVFHSDLSKLIIAYEPRWAIGANKSAEPTYVWQAHQYIREIIADIFNESVARKVRIIYGGSVMKETTADLIKNEHVDGVFVGRFGHDPKNFKKIVSIVKENKL